MKAEVSRRGLMGAAAALGLTACAGEGGKTYPGALLGPSVDRGHALRGLDPAKAAPANGTPERTSILIAGGGAAGLACGWRLAEAGFTDFTLIELEDETGGNARGGGNNISAFPWGAHYLPVPNREAVALIHMLRQFGMITGDEGGAPVYDPFQLCADMEERLFWQGKWQEGLYPATGLSSADIAQRDRFSAAMEAFKHAMGRDGKPAFASPMALSSADPAYTALDDISMAQWLQREGYTSAPLLAYIRYCCRDDYGAEPDHTSAWAGIRYFACRRGWAAKGDGERELTWPEGNGRLTRMMADRIDEQISRGQSLTHVARQEDGTLLAHVWDYHDGLRLIRADVVVLAMPHFVARHVAPGLGADGFSYAPWVVANVTLKRRPEGPGVPLAWDNVSAGSGHLGYVVATHQTQSSLDGPCVVTWYTACSQGDPAAVRRDLLTRPLADWQKIIADDLLVMNPDLEDAITRIDVWRWGHAMIRPTPGFLTDPARLAAEALDGRILYAHSDVSGLSLFEEAHYRGVAAAEAALRQLDHPHESLL